MSIRPTALVRATDGGTPRLATALRVAHRAGDLLVRFDGRDDGWVATKTRRDDALWEEDVFEVFLAADDPPHFYWEFEVNPLGTMFDAAIQSPRLFRPTICVDVAWDCPGFRATVKTSQRSWSARMRIPLGALAAGPVSRTWRANFFRVDRGPVDELSAWSPILSDPIDFHDARRFGTLVLDDSPLPTRNRRLGRSRLTEAEPPRSGG